MKKIKVLDCTLRDGGYVNDWNFGADNARQIVSDVGKAGVDYIELGFIDNFEGDDNPDQIQFNNMDKVTRIFKPSLYKLAIMVNIGYGYPSSAFPKHSEKTVDLVRLVTWERMMKDGVVYSQQLIDKGYEVCLNLTRTPQYSLERFRECVNLYKGIPLSAVYIVDTFGQMTKEDLLSYANILDEILDEKVRIGYHAHNNMQQALVNSIALCEQLYKHDLIVDASVYGMGRGAGNLSLELFLKYLNNNKFGVYDINPLLEVMENNIKKFYVDTPWGYSMPYLISGINGRNPSYVNYMQKKGLSIVQIEQIYRKMRELNVGITYDEKMCDDLIKTVLE